MKYLVHFRYKPDINRQEVGKLLPAEQARTAQLHKDGLIEALHVSTDVSQGWIVMVADSEDDVTEALESLPLHPFLTTEITPINTPVLG